MGTKNAALFERLNAPFDDVKSRAGGGGRQLSYITARQATIRLDEVLGPENWRSKYRVVKLEGDAGQYDAIICTLELRIDGEWIAKEGAGGFKEMTEKTRGGQQEVDEENTAKTGFSDAFKRAAVEWGIARYLYKDGEACFEPEPEPEPAPAPVAAAPKRDERTAAQLVDDAVAKLNASYREVTPGADDLTDGPTAVDRLLFLAWNQKLTKIEPNPKEFLGDKVNRLEALYKAERQWVRRELKTYLESLDPAAKEVAA